MVEVGVRPQQLPPALAPTAPGTSRAASARPLRSTAASGVGAHTRASLQRTQGDAWGKVLSESIQIIQRVPDVRLWFRSQVIHLHTFPSPGPIPTSPLASFLICVGCGQSLWGCLHFVLASAVLTAVLPAQSAVSHSWGESVQTRGTPIWQPLPFHHVSGVPLHACTITHNMLTAPPVVSTPMLLAGHSPLAPVQSLCPRDWLIYPRLHHIYRSAARCLYQLPADLFQAPPATHFPGGSV